jgi:hypothetical protein
MALITTFGDPLSAHLGLHVIGRDFGRRNHFALFAGKRLLIAPVEKVSDVRVFFSFGHAQVLPIGLAHDIRQNIRRIFAR